MVLIEEEKTRKLIACFFEVYNHLGAGFIESVYKDALALEFNIREIPFEKEKLLYTYYKSIKLDKHFLLDFLCFDSVIIEVKAVSSILPIHKMQLHNYLKASNLKVGLLVNFGETSLKFERVIKKE